jgi:hypothetical protein
MAVKLSAWPPFTPRKIHGTHFRQKPCRPKAIVGLEGLGQWKNPPRREWNRNPPACSIVSQPTMGLHSLLQGEFRPPLDGRMTGPQRRSGRCREKKNIWAFPVIESRILGHPPHSPSLC